MNQEIAANINSICSLGNLHENLIKKREKKDKFSMRLLELYFRYGGLASNSFHLFHNDKKNPE